jgi:hypothetical protein
MEINQEFLAYALLGLLYPAKSDRYLGHNGSGKYRSMPSRSLESASLYYSRVLPTFQLASTDAAESR